MDPIKVSGVQDWKVPKTVKDIHVFLGFCNFYCHFIHGFSQIAKPLNNLLKKGTKWLWGTEEIRAFEKLKKQICKEPVLIQPDQKKPFEVEVDTSNYACGTILTQCNNKNVLHPVVFFSKTMNEAQCNYDVYNQELLALIEMFRHWRHYLHQAVHKVKVHTDHANLLFWKNPGDHNRRVVQWHAELMEYDFKLVHILGKKNGRADTLSRCPDYDQGDNDNKNITVLPLKFFSKVYAKYVGMSEERTPAPAEYGRVMGSEHFDPNNLKEAEDYRMMRGEFANNNQQLDQLIENQHWGKYQRVQNMIEEDQQTNQESQERIRRWTNTHQLIKLVSIWWKDEQIIVAGDNNLKMGVIHFLHDTLSAGHPGIENTYELAKCDVWWPNMKQDIKQYVKCCATCQANKVNT